MGMFTDLMNKIFHSSAGMSAEATPAFPSGAGGGGSIAPAQPTEGGAGAGGSAATTAQPIQAKDVAAILDKMASESKQKLNWKHSIVDLMKLVGMDSSLEARRELAADLKYSGDTKDTATMNIWLHKEVMKKLAENGGKVPKELLAA